MTAANFRLADDAQRAEMIEAIAAPVWGAIKEWQAADPDGRPQMDYATIVEAAEDYLRSNANRSDFDVMAETSQHEILAKLNRAGAALYLQ